MKIPSFFAATSLLLLVAGCASHERSEPFAQYPPASSSTYSSTYSSGGTGETATAGSMQSAQGAGVSDNDVVTQVRQALERDSSLTSVVPNLEISAAGGSVTLAGTVTSEEQKQNIESIVRQTSGVTSINNQLQISSSAAASIGGQEFAGSSTNTNTLQTAEAAEGQSLTGTSRPNESSSVYSGSGNEQSGSSNQVNSSGSQSSTTGESTTGAAGDINVMVLGSSEADQSLGQKITQQLGSDTALNSALSKVRISLQDGRVTLQGSVSSEQQRRDVESAIKRVAGVSAVDNQLQVGAGQSNR